TRPGVWFLKTLITSTIIVKPTTRPISGARIMNAPIFRRPLATSEPKPALTTAAPAKPPISAWEELVGNPQTHVIRSHTIATMSPATITHWSTTAVPTTPLPTLRPTPTPKPNAAPKVKNAAQPHGCTVLP